MARKVFLPAFSRAQHPQAGQNTQHPSVSLCLQIAAIITRFDEFFTFEMFFKSPFQRLSFSCRFQANLLASLTHLKVQVILVFKSLQLGSEYQTRTVFKSLQLGSEYQTRLVFEWLKVVQSLNVHELNSCSITSQLTEWPLGYQQTSRNTSTWYSYSSKLSSFVNYLCMNLLKITSNYSIFA